MSRPSSNRAPKAYSLNSTSKSFASIVATDGNMGRFEHRFPPGAVDYYCEVQKKVDLKTEMPNGSFVLDV